MKKVESQIKNRDGKIEIDGTRDERKPQLQCKQILVRLFISASSKT